MANTEDGALRKQLVEFLRGNQAHADLKSVLDGFPEKLRGKKPQGSPHSAWQLLEHIRLALRDLLDFSTNSSYVALKWPDGYWPAEDAPPSDDAWEASLRAVKKDMADFEKLIGEPKTNLYATIPWGEGQTILREVLLAGQHTSYHLGQLVLLRRELGAWKDE
ncbi:MAG: DinB family protein [Acidobacteriaceae bacterium]